MNSEKKRVIVVGAGAAGIGAARWLLDNDVDNVFDVVVLESKSRIGGRVHTNTEFGVPIDLGASWLHDHCGDNPMSIISQTLNIPLKKSNWDNDITCQLNGERFKDKITERAWDTVETSFYAASKRGKAENSSEGLEILMKREMGPKRWQDPTVQSYMAGLDFELGTSLHNISSFAIDDIWHKSYVNDDDDIDMAFPGTGYVGVLQALVTGEGSRNSKMQSNRRDTPCREMCISFNHKVLSVRDNCRLDSNPQSNITIHALNTNPSDASFNQVIEMEADFVLVTLPLGVLKSSQVTFAPELSLPKQHSILQCGTGNVVKVVMEFKKVFWPSNTEFLNIADESLCDSYDYNVTDNANNSANRNQHHQQRGLLTHFWNYFIISGRKILIGFGLGDGADAMDEMSDDLLLSLIESRVASFANRNQQSLPKSTFIPVRWMRTRWSSDPDACGVYSYYPRGGSGEGMFLELGRKEGEHMYFAGEATQTSTALRSSVRGAWHSGVRAAEEISLAANVPVTIPGHAVFNA